MSSSIFRSTTLYNATLMELLTYCHLFPAIGKAVLIALTLPVSTSTCQVERSFSTLRRVKTWLRSTMSTEHLSGLCMLSVHQQVLDRKDAIIKDVIDCFGSLLCLCFIMSPHFLPFHRKIPADTHGCAII